MEVLILIKSGESLKAEKQAYKSLYLKYTVFITSATNHMIQTQVFHRIKHTVNKNNIYSKLIIWDFWDF